MGSSVHSADEIDRARKAIENVSKKVPVSPPPEVTIYIGATESRTADQNGKIYGIQKSNGNNPVWLSAHIRKKISELVTKHITGPIDAGQRPKTKAAVDAIADEHLKAIDKNIRNERSEKGPMKPPSSEYVRRKMAIAATKTYQFTGQLRRAFRARTKS